MTSQGEQVTSVRDQVVKGLHEMGWFARGDLDPDLLGDLIGAVVDLVRQTLAEDESLVERASEAASGSDAVVIAREVLAAFVEALAP